MVRKLPTFRGHIVDVKLRQFRTAGKNLRIQFIAFASPEGDTMLNQYVKAFNPKKESDMKKLADIANSL